MSGVVMAEDRITFTLDKGLKQELQITLVKTGESMTDVFRRAAKDYVHKHNMKRVYS